MEGLTSLSICKSSNWLSAPENCSNINASETLHNLFERADSSKQAKIMQIFLILL